MIDLASAERILLGKGPDTGTTLDGEAVAVAVVAERDLLVVAGADAGSYLQGQISQDAEGLAVGATSWTLLLQPQGKVEAWLRLHRLADDRFLLDVDTGFGEVAMTRLERFKLRVDAEIVLSTAAVLSVRGPGSATIASQATSDVLALDASWGGIDGVDLLALDADGQIAISDAAAVSAERLLAAQLAAGSLVEGPDLLLDVARVLQGMPTMGRELDESTIPAAAKIVDQSVDFTKGCYVGQELVARIDSRGNNTPTRLVGLRFGGPTLPEAGTDLLLDGASAGRVTSVVDSASSGGIGLAYLKRAVEVPATLQVQPASGPLQTVEVVDLPTQRS